MLIIWGKLKEKSRATTNGCDLYVLERGTSHGACGHRHQLHGLASASGQHGQKSCTDLTLTKSCYVLHVALTVAVQESREYRHYCRLSPVLGDPSSISTRSPS